MDVYDSFRPLAITSRIFGLFPVRSTRQRPYRRACIYSLLAPAAFVTSCFAWVIHFESVDWHYFTLVSVINVANLADFFNVTVTVPALYCIAQVKFKAVSDLMSKLHSYDLVMSGEVKHRRVKVASWTYVVVLATIFLMHVFTGQMSSGRDLQMLPSYALYSYMVFAAYVPVTQAVFFSEAIRIRFASVTRGIRHIVRLLPSSFHAPKHPSQVQGATRPLTLLSGAYDDLCQTVTSVNDAYGLSLAIIYLHILITLVRAGSVVLLVSGDRPILFPVVHAVTKVALVTLSTIMMDRLPYQASAALHDLRKIDLSSLGWANEKQIRDLITKMTYPEVEITAGFFRIRSATLTAMAASMTTYFVVIAQFKHAEQSCSHSNICHGNATAG